MTEYHLKCPECGHEFDFNYSQWNSLSDPHIGISYRWGRYEFEVKCPSCHERSYYHVSEKDEVPETPKQDSGSSDTWVPLILGFVLAAMAVFDVLLGLRFGSTLFLPLLVTSAGVIVVIVIVYLWTSTMRNEVTRRRLERKGRTP